MKSVIPYKKEIEFKTRIAEICSISLEQQYEVKNHVLSGEFTVSGDYRIHEVSINKEVFNYQLPFSVDLPDNVVEESVDLQILDFTYDVIDEEKLDVDIEFKVEAEEMEEEVRDDEEREMVDVNEELDKLIMQIDNAQEEDVEEKRDNIVNEEEVVEEKEEIPTEIMETEKENTYITYHIHIVKESESVEGIASLYNTSRAVLEEYNDVANLVVGDKLIIPIEDNE